ncbi:Haloacid Dehalogenase Superfamily Class (subfamily) IIA/haloacid dehalogenase superfamily, subfamily IA, variant 1 with third motif having Dx(3-4)D or Dx(3-4)E [Micromonospora rhizosphaerae]|uniref:Haloacid Dehalogenase Superfamily Class (Subfamily) IIA/haloacid dehalogenase superfamily, subfamily IA, variant 1 with third motif having Dx(3-4)D or Dx(3-4)E n=1 Tax=Micromonospora rhizosphaerae TaxID=568872 RepID=A0A1C6S7Q6_9ACTN|nr:HAD-IIA family hydrolase [Micromonospora rhizosphaerae]SCL25506.1 Haloacid Dehalogenase Superfamily Class (subfamily) IIA/haloacid dehalogenase superfamily, subfamily IA, variant 1 with third motif having Dx(3-4)D or Dx(3-4)E [Micromonospora rhizosphaerae]
MTTVAGKRLVDGYALVVFDLDGVIYLIDRPIPGAVEAVARLHAEGRAVAYATNNASRRSSEVTALLTGMGVPARPEEVLTSAAATAELLRDRLPDDAAVLVVGAEALRAEIRAVGLRPVSTADEEPAAVVQGYGPEVGWVDLAEATVAVRAGAPWYATNTDRTLPSGRGPLPGNGSLVAVLRTALDREPDVVVGKPEPALFATAARRAGSGRTLVVGDRLDTDIEGARRAGLDSLLVLTGVSDVPELLAAPERRRPTHVSFDLAGLFEPAAVARVPGEPELGGWSVDLTAAGLVLSGAGRPLDALAALCAVAWSASVGPVVRAASPAAEEALWALGLPA